MRTVVLIVSVFIYLIVFSESRNPTLNPGSANASQTDSVKYKTGERIFKRNCSVCHGFDKKIVGNPIDRAWRKYNSEWLYNYLSDDKAFSSVDSTAARINTTKNGEAVYSHRFKNEISRDDYHALLYFMKTNSKKI